ncbi:MAG: formate/nitrite transporter family protein [Oscillospiraceae bacterium]
MLQQEFEALSQSAVKKLGFMRRSPFGFFVASMVAGMFISFGGFVSMTVGGLCTAAGSTVTKLLSAFAFASALSLVVMAGSELFTGNNLVMGAALLTRKARLKNVLLLWLLCWAGNLAGSWILVLLYWFSGACGGSVAEYFSAVAASKLSLSVVQMLLRGILCNICVCLAVWCCARMKSESAKLIMIFWCIFIFFVCGFEHSIANMSILGVAILEGSAGIPGYIINLAVVTLGNMLGGIAFVALPYWLMSRK